jgi:hypothetical protein
MARRPIHPVKHLERTMVKSALLAGTLGLVFLGVVPAGWAQSTGANGDVACDRACMRGLADGLVASMVAHQPGNVPLVEHYRATENGVPAGLAMMSLWRTFTKASSRQYYIDPISHQMLVAVTVNEGPAASLFWARLKVEGRRFSELEMYLTRSRGDAGFMFDAAGLGHMPDVWTRKVDPKLLPAREVLLDQGKAMFAPSMAMLPGGPECALMENGAVVHEEAEWMQYMGGPGGPGGPAGAAPPGGGMPPMPAGPPPGARKGGAVTMAGGCPLMATRPGDPNARVDIADTEQGVVVALAMVDGLIYTYPVTKPTWSAFVPTSLQGMHLGTLEKALASGKYHEPMVETMPATIVVAQLWRIFDGKIQGFHMLQKLGPVGSGSPWVPRAAAAGAK